jgi:histone-lysine N-methyltransferase SETMAR
MEALKQLKQRIERVRPCRRTNQFVLPHDNTRPPTGMRTRKAIATMGWTVLPPPPFGPDLAPIDLNLFGPLKEALRGRRVAGDELNYSVCEEL